MGSRATACALHLAFCLAAAPAAAFETDARAAMVVDHATGVTLFEKDSHAPLPPASMSKLMTLYMLFEALKEGRVTLDTEFEVSAKAQAMGGSRMFVEAGTRVPVEDLIRGIIVHSGNDACVVVAEGLAGTEAAFAEAMTRRAAEIGLTESTLKNSSGWPEADHIMSVADLATLTRRLIDDFPDLYPYFAETEYTWGGITQPNRNPLLRLDIGADGLKTGHTQEAGYGLAGSAVQNGQRIVFVTTGLDSSSHRRSETEAMVKWAFGAFDTLKFFEEGATVTEADVWLGEAPTVPLVAPRDLQMLVPRETRNDVTAEIVYTGPIEAPIAAGQVLGQLTVDVPDHDPASFDLVAGEAVERGGLGVRIGAAAKLARDRALELITGRE